jgi:hypothetical protein
MDDCLRKRVWDATMRLDAAFRATEETPEKLNDLADAADQLMRAAGRVLIEAKRELGDDAA